MVLHQVMFHTRFIPLPSRRYCTATTPVLTYATHRRLRQLTGHVRAGALRCHAGVHVRPAQHKDIQAVSQLDAATAGLSAGWSEQTFAEAISNSLNTILVAERQGHANEADTGALPQLLGFACMRVVAGEAQLENLAVLPQAQGQGIGHALLSQLLQVCGCFETASDVTCYLEVRADNAAAIRLYKALGFQEAGLRKRFYADGTDALLMTRPAGPAISL